MIYLASPYSSPDGWVRAWRFAAVTQVAAEMMKAGRLVFCPIAHSHAMAAFGLPEDWTFWEQLDRRMLAACDELVVLCLPGWRESVGVQAEIDIALQLGMSISLMPMP